ncbi:MAG: hypothetical protein OES09_18305 [Gammaproteobacteria bacterium]|nr:hypothetical protein [Gammaproteobacteria bacterium]
MKLLVLLALTFVALTIFTSRVTTEDVSFQAPGPASVYTINDPQMAMVETSASGPIRR